MKFQPFALTLALCARRSLAFAPSSVSTKISAPISTSNIIPSARRSFAFAPEITEQSRRGQVANSGLNLLGKLKRFNAEAEVQTDVTVDEVRALFSLWNSALATGDSRIVASRYTKSPVLLPTVSDTPRTDFDSVKDYFDAFLLKEPQGKIVDGHISIGDGWASDTGIYEFTLGATGDKVKARYTFLYVQEEGIWKIQHHHSSVMPEEIAMGKAITEDEVKGLFSLWNDALATLDPKTVANRYANKGVLLPTVSDTPRTDYAGIEDYFTNFLKLEPQGEILESNVVIGMNWAQDCGKSRYMD
jgi:uncharacterized protein (TIGR02246 family)